MKKNLKLIITGIIVFFISTTIAYSADPDHHLMNNDHDTLVIGMVVAIYEDEIVIQAIDFITSENGIDRPQLTFETARITGDNRLSNLQVEDHILASLNQEGDLFVVAWGIYQIELTYMLGWQVWYVETGDTMRSALLSDFINQEGRYTYSMRDGLVIRHQGDAEIIVYDPDPPSEIQPRIGENAACEDEEEELPSMTTFAFVGGASFLIVGVAWMMYRKSKSNIS